ncbi:hypothetical protein U1Q18_051060, partial [Sarracenia purpurea var. burkii]
PTYVRKWLSEAGLEEHENIRSLQCDTARRIYVAALNNAQKDLQDVQKDAQKDVQDVQKDAQKDVQDARKDA